MNIKIWYNLHKTRKTLEPSRQFKRKLGKSLSNKFDEVYGKPGIWYRYVWVRTTRVILASTVGFSLVSTSAYAYNSPQVAEGNILYPVKLGIEKVEEQTKVTTEAKVKFLIKQADRRVAEHELLVKKYDLEVNRPRTVLFVATTTNITNDIVTSATSTTTTVEIIASSTISSTESKNEPKREINNKNERRSIVNIIKKAENKTAESGDKKNKEKLSNDVKKSEIQISNVELRLEEAKLKLKDNEQDKKLRQIIDERLEKNRESEKKEREREFERKKENEQRERRENNDEESAEKFENQKNIDQESSDERD